MKILLFVLFSFCFQYAHSQEFLNEITSFYKNADKDFYYQLLKDKTIDSIYSRWQVESQISNVLLEYSINEIDEGFKKIDRRCIKYILRIKIDTLGGIIDNNIYNNIKIDCTLTFGILVLNKLQKNTVRIEINDYLFVDNFSRNNKIAFRKILRKNPDLLLYCDQLSYIGDNHGYMYLKNGKIFVYRLAQGDFIELNDYFQNYYH